jgi:hypothetical protein
MRLNCQFSTVEPGIMTVQEDTKGFHRKNKLLCQMSFQNKHVTIHKNFFYDLRSF